MFKKKYKNKGLNELAEASIHIAANPWYAPTPTTIVVGSSHGATTQYWVKEEVESLIDRIHQVMVSTDSDFFICIDVDDYTAEQVWVDLGHIVAIIKNKREGNDAT